MSNAMSVGALREAIINACDLEGAFGQNLHESKGVMLRVRPTTDPVDDLVFPLQQVSVGFDARTGSVVMYLSAAS